MATTVEVTDDGVEIRFSGTEQLATLSSGLTLRIDEITGARVAPRDVVQDGVGWRIGGTYWPGRIAAGWFTVPGRRGARQLWSVYRDAEVLVIDTTRDKPCRVVLQHPDRNDVAWYIGERLPRR